MQTEHILNSKLQSLHHYQLSDVSDGLVVLVTQLLHTLIAVKYHTSKNDYE